MKPTTMHVTFLCDCEAMQHAIRDADLGERSARGLAALQESLGLRGTYFVIPPDLEAHPAMCRELVQRGHEVNLHLHAAEHDAGEFLGVLDEHEQRRVIIEVRDRFAQVMGTPPEGICLGYGSASDMTYPLLIELGFRHGQASVPGRILPECASVRAGAPMHIHYAHRSYRLLPGDLNFVEIPGAVDPDSRMWGGEHCQDLRVELVDAKNHWYTIDKAVRRQVADPPAVAHLKIATHNIFEYSDSKDFRRQTGAGIADVCERHGVTWQAATESELASLYRAAVALPRQAEHPVLDTRGRQFL